MEQQEKEVDAPVEPATDDPGVKDRVSGLGQTIIGELETIGGVLTADPNTQAEGEFNIEVGTIRENLEDEDIGEED